MANVAKINGYNVKDAEARGDISTLQESMTTAQGDIETLQGDLSDTKADLGDVTQLETTVKTSAVNAINEVKGEADDNASSIAQNTANFAPAFSDVTSYAVGDYVTYNNILYRCTTAHSAGVWVAGHFTYATVGNELQNVRAVPILKKLPILSYSSTITFSDTQSETKILFSTTITTPRKGDLILCLPNFILTTTGPYQFNISIEFAGDTYIKIYSTADNEGPIGYVPFLLRDVPAGTHIMDVKGSTTGAKNATVFFYSNESYFISGTLY